MSILIQNGTLLCPEGPVRADLRVEGETIVQIGPDLPPGDSRVIDAAGKLVFPGFIDTHTHFEMNKGTERETADDWTTGTRAALAGGTTCVLDFAEPERGASLQSALETWHDRAEGRASCHYGFHMTVKDWDRRILAELPSMTAQGVTSYKVYLAYPNLRISDRTAYEVIRAVAEQGGVVGCHCENGDLIEAATAQLRAAGRLSPASHPLSHAAVMEDEAVTRWLALAEQAGAPVNVVHLSTRRGLEAARRARARGQKVYLETCPQYLTLTEEKYSLPGFQGAKYVCAPPLRMRDYLAALWQGVENGDFLAQGGMARRIITMPGRSSYKTMRYSGQFQLDKSEAQRERLEAEVALPFCAWPGDLVVVERGDWDRNGRYRVVQATVGMDERGCWTRLDLARPDFVV